MVLGLKSKLKKGSSVRAEYIVNISEIRPWPPFESLKSIQTVILQWENGTENSGSFVSVAGHSNIVFDESFMLTVTLRHKKSTDRFKKNILEFSLFEPHKDRARGHLLGTAVLNLADYALVEEDVVNVDVPFNFKKSSADGWGQPALAISLELVGRGSSGSSPSVGFFSREENEDDDDSEIASLTDDDVASSHSSRTNGSSNFEAAFSSPSRGEKNGYGNTAFDPQKDRDRNSRALPTRNASSDTWGKVKDYVSLTKFSERSMSFAKKNSTTPLVISSPISVTLPDNERFNSLLNKTRDDTQQIRMDRSIDVKSNSLHSLINTMHVDLDEQSKLNEKFPEDASRRSVALRNDTLIPNRKGQGVPPSGSNKARLKHVKSVQIQGSVKGNGFPADMDIPNGSQKKGGKISSPAEGIDLKTDDFDSKNEWKSRAEMLEDELRETAAIEVALYSVVAEHSSSVNKVHAPARRLSRFYKNACRTGSQAKRASAARAAVSGLVLVSKACGNDVPRLTFWLSNVIMLRSIVSQIAAELPHFDAPKQQQSKTIQESDDCEDILTLIIALEKVESWMFTRIIESVWWQTITPHMLPTVGKGSRREKDRGAKKASGRSNYLGDHEQGSFSIELWKKAFRDACERLCPIRVVGHECGCLSVLVMMAMEQLVSRLDVAMFNAILRESAEEMPMDPLSDPISDLKVLPVPAGKLSFRAGAQLKNVIGNWSRWLSDLFGLDDHLSEDSVASESSKRPKSFKPFRFLHALSDLMMLPFGMLADVSTRNEVCPMFGPAIIRRVLTNFVPDEFSPNPIPRHIMDALDSEEISESSNFSITSLPCTATPIKYTPPPAALLTCMGEVGRQVLKSSRLSTLEKSCTSDEDLDELDSPLTSIIPDSHYTSSALARLGSMPKEKGGGDTARYQLLREVWRDEEE